jgi:hypothetical protein
MDVVVQEGIPMNNEIDAATVALCAGQSILARWQYELDTSNDDDYPHISYGQMLLREDGRLFQRVEFSHGGFSPWGASRRAPDGPYTPEDVLRIIQWPESDYWLTGVHD